MSNPRRDDKKIVTSEVALTDNVAYFTGEAETIIAERNPLYRGGVRGFDTIFQKGYKSWGSNLDILSHVIGAPTENVKLVDGFHDSAYISTSSSKYQASKFPVDEHLPKNTKYTYLYEIHTSRPIIEINPYLELYKKTGQISLYDYEIYHQEKEFAFTNKIYPHEIKGGWRLKIETNRHAKIVDSPFIPNENYVPPIIPYKANKLLTASRYAGNALTGLGMGLDIGSLYNQYQISKETGDYNNTYRESTRIAGGWAGAWLGGSAGAELGAIACLPFSPVASAGCSIAGGLVGAIAGYKTGSEVTTRIYDVAKSNNCPSTFGIFSSPAYAHKFIEEIDEDNEIMMSGVSDENKAKSRSINVLQVPAHVSHSSFSITDSEKEICHFQTEVQDLINQWCDEASNILGYEKCHNIVTLVDKYNVVKLAYHKNPTAELRSKYKTVANQLKDEKLKEYYKRHDFDQKLQTAQGIVNSVGGLAALSGNPELANKIIVGGGALVSIVKEIGSLANIGTAAACANPAAAVGTVVLSLCSLASLFGKKRDNTSQIMLEQLREIQRIILDLRKEIHERFDMVDERLEALHTELEASFEINGLQHQRTLIETYENRRENKKFHEHTHLHLESVQGKIDNLVSVTRQHAISQEITKITDTIYESIHSLELMPSPDKYNRWITQFKMFLEQSVLSVLLTGADDSIDNPDNWKLDGKKASEAHFHVNTLSNFLKVSNKNKSKQPNQLLWIYTTLATLRLILLANNKDSGTIRDTEFEILSIIKEQSHDIIQFYLDLQKDNNVINLVGLYEKSLSNVISEIVKLTKEINDTKNKYLNSQLRNLLEINFIHQEKKLATQNIDIGVSYSSWFQGYTVCHYDATEFRDNSLVTPARSSYIAHRTELRDNVVKKIPPRQKLPDNTKIVVSSDNKKVWLNINISELKSIFPITLSPENPSDPFLPLTARDGSRVDLGKILAIPDNCYQAIYLGLGHLSFQYQFAQESNLLKITAYMICDSIKYEISSVDMSLYIGPYERNEGIVWGWFGDTSLTLSTLGPTSWIGSTGEDKHWFLDYGTVPSFSCPDAGPFESLRNPTINNARSIKKVVNTNHISNLSKIDILIKNKVEEIVSEHESTIKSHIHNPATSLGKAIIELNRSSQRLLAYAMLCHPDDSDNNNVLISEVFEFISQISQSSLQKLLDIKSNLSVSVKACTINGPKWTDLAGYNNPQFSKTINVNPIMIGGTQHIAMMIRNVSYFEIHLLNPKTGVIEKHVGPTWTSDCGYNQAQFYETIRTEVISVNGTQQLALMARNVSNYAIHLFNPVTKAFLGFKGPEWSNKAGYHLPEHYETIRTNVITINGIEHLAMMIRSVSHYEIHLLNPLTGELTSHLGPEWRSASGYSMPKFNHTIRTEVITVNGTQQLALMARNVSYYAIYLFNPVTKKLLGFKGPEWSDKAGYQAPEHYETIRTNVITVNGIEHLAMMIRSVSHYEIHLLNPLTGNISSNFTLEWSNAKGCNKPEFSQSIRTEVAKINDIECLLIAAIKNNSVETYVFNPITNRTNLLDNFDCADLSKNDHGSFRLLPVVLDKKQALIVMHRTSQEFIIKLKTDLNDYTFKINGSALELPIKLVELQNQIDSKLRKPLVSLFKSKNEMTNNILFDQTFILIQEMYQFFKDKVVQTESYTDIFEENSQVKQQYEQVALLLKATVETISSEIDDDALKLKIINEVQRKIASYNAGNPRLAHSSSPLQQIGFYASNSERANPDSSVKADNHMMQPKK